MNCLLACLPACLLTAVPLTLLPRRLQDFTAHIAQAHIANFATPRAGGAPPYRFLFHAQAAGSGAHVLVQVTVAKSPAGSAAAVVKSDDVAAAGHVVDLLQNLLLTL